jgi:hypothetical protein
MLGGPETEQDAGGRLFADGARWVAEHQVSILAWDMLDSRDAKAAYASAHVLTWAIALAARQLRLRRAAPRARPRHQGGGRAVVSLLAVEGANGVNLNPWC